MLYDLARRWLFRFDPEHSHELALNALQRVYHSPLASVLKPSLPNSQARQVMGLSFPNPVGLAAGLDKNGQYIDALASLGFGFIEIGTITPRPQAGNPKPRLFRLPQAEAVINRMGFNNQGVEYLIEQVKAAQFKGILGINIGKNIDTPVERAADDYLLGLTKVYPYASYITVNVSSPNTPGLRDLQYGEALEKLLSTLKAAQTQLAEQYGRYVPLALKLAPDLNDLDIPLVAQALVKHKMDGVIATNTTFSRQGVEGLPFAQEAGGLSGRPLLARSTEVVRLLAQAVDGALPIIAVGGIFSAQDAQAKLDAGASLVQLYSGLVYRGPNLVAEVVRGLHAAA